MMDGNGELTSKVCHKCQQERPIDQFNKDKRYADGYFTWCKPCMKAYRDERKKDPEKAAHDSKRTMDWYWKNREEKKAKNNARSRERYHNEPGYREKKSQQKRESVGARKKRDPEYAEKKRIQSVKSRRLRRARLLELEEHFTQQEWEYICRHYDYTCLKCGRREPEIKLAADHVIPLVKGGKDTIDNIQPLCKNCNSRKHAKTVDYRPDGGVGMVFIPTPRQLKLVL